MLPTECMDGTNMNLKSFQIKVTAPPLCLSKTKSRYGPLPSRSLPEEPL